MKQKMIITMIACIGFSYSAIAQKAHQDQPLV